MKSGSTDGVVEAWVDGEKIYSYTGDVNHGQDFADIYLQSDGAGTFFSNVIISNCEIKLGEGYHAISVDTERRVKNIVEVTADVARNVTFPIVVPLIGEHFNHFVQSVTVFKDSPQRIILPKRGDVYIRAKGEGAVRIYSDVYESGFVTGAMYANLAECRTVFIKASFSQLQVIKAFMHSLDETTLTGDAALDEAINFCTGGLIADKATLVENLMSDLNSPAPYTDYFLINKCGINLDNADTGAITGSDAKSSAEQMTPKGIVPEPIPVEEWVVPTRGSSKTIRGLTVQFPTSGASGSLSDVEKHILAGLNSVWIEQSLILIEKSFGLDFNEEGTTVKTIGVKFENDSTSSALAYVSYAYNDSDGKTTALNFVVNMYYYTGINLSSVDGASNSGYLDRTIAHEFTHAVMAANIDNFYSLPQYIKEGAAELVHGIDDERYNSITYLTRTSAGRNKLEEIFSTGGTSSDGAYPYAAGYILLRYLAKQGQDDSLAPASLEITDLLISDGSTDSNYNARTDNTRQILYPDVLRTLIRTTEDNFDVEIMDVLPVEFTADAKRSLLAKIFLFAKKSSSRGISLSRGKSLRGENSSGEIIIPSGNNSSGEDILENTEGLQNFELTIAEKQITDQIRFTGTMEFDIQQAIEGKFLDYEIGNMIVERSQQQGILHTYECCSDLELLLYTQFNFDEETEENPGESSAEDDDEEKEFPYASENISRIAEAMGLRAGGEYNDFQSTVILEDSGGSTYYDLIRDIFGWTARIPNKMMNVFLAGEDSICIFQRGKEKLFIWTNTTIHCRQSPANLCVPLGAPLLTQKPKLPKNPILFPKATTTRKSSNGLPQVIFHKVMAGLPRQLITTSQKFL